MVVLEIHSGWNYPISSKNLKGGVCGLRVSTYLLLTILHRGFEQQVTIAVTFGRCTMRAVTI